MAPKLHASSKLKPHYVVGENVPGIINIAADEVCADLEREGYEVRIFNFEAAAVGAPHRRARVAFVAHDSTKRLEAERPEQQTARVARSGADVAYADEQGLQRRVSGELQECTRQRTIGPRCPLCNTASEGLQNGADIEMGRCKPFQESQRSNWWTVEPDVGRVAHGIPNRVDRIKALGNAVVPQQFYPIFKAIAELEDI